MPVRKLPKKLVERLKRVSQRIEQAFPRMEIIDHRRNWRVLHQSDVYDWGVE